MTVTIQELQREGVTKQMPRFKIGQTVRVYEKIREGEKERIQIFEGLIIQIKGIGAGRTITVRKIVGGIGVEKIFSIHSPVVEKIEITKEARVRRSKLFFMRGRRGKSARLKEKFLTEEDIKQMMPHEVTEEELTEAVEAQKTEEEKETETEGDVKPEENKVEEVKEKEEEVTPEKAEEVSETKEEKDSDAEKKKE